MVYSGSFQFSDRASWGPRGQPADMDAAGSGRNRGEVLYDNIG